MTHDLQKRFEQHNKGEVSSTKGRIPFILVYFEEVTLLKDARKREKYFKSGFGRKYIHNKMKTMALSSNG